MPINIIEKNISIDLATDLNTLVSNIESGGGSVSDISYGIAQMTGDSNCFSAMVWYTGDAVSNP